MKKLFPDLPEEEWPTYGTVPKDTVYFMTPKRAIPLVPTPPPFRNHGNHVTSVAQLGRFLGEKAEEAGVYILPETAAYKLLVEDGVVRGIRSGDKGRGREGEELGNFEPGLGPDRAGDRARRGDRRPPGRRRDLSISASASEDPPQWELGVKEVWEVKKPLDRVIHSMGWPLRFGAKYREFGGCFIYPMGEDKVSIGFVAGLDYRDATFSVHDTLQLFKTHPKVKKILEGGKRVAWGAKTIPSGGYWAMPKQLWAPGMVLAGDSASMVNIPKLKGVHLAMHAGMFAAEAIYEKLSQGADCTDLSSYQEKVEDSHDRDGPPPLAQHAPGIREGLPRRRRARERDGDLGRALPRRPVRDPRRREPAGLHRQPAEEVSEAGRQVHVRQALVGLRDRQPVA